MAQSWARLSPVIVDAAGVMMPSGISQREQNSPRTEVEPESGPINAPPPPLPLPSLRLTKKEVHC